MALLSLVGTLKKENRFISGALLRISQALLGLGTSLQEFRELETTMGLESAAEVDCSGVNDTGPDFLGVVAGTLKEMVGKLVSDIEAKPEIQKLLLVIQKSLSEEANEDATIANQGSSCVVGTVPSCEAEGMRRVVKRAAVDRAMGCRHFCAVHPEVMDPCLWKTLTVELVQQALARLPCAKLLDIYAHPPWSTISSLPSFRQVCFERQPKLFGLMAVENLQLADIGKLCNVVYDTKLNEWIRLDLVGFQEAFVNKGPDWADWHLYMAHASYTCDGGLVCFVPETRRLTDSQIRIGNPLTDEWRALPYLPCLPGLPDEDWQQIMVQLVAEADSKCYKVILVFRIQCWGTKKYAAQRYDSKSGAWSYMESGLVFGNAADCLTHSGEDPCVFDCTTKTLYKLVDWTTHLKTLRTREKVYTFVDLYTDRQPNLQGSSVARQCTMVKDRLFVLHEWSSISRGSTGFQVSQYAWQSDTSDLRIINSTAPINLRVGREVFFSASCGSMVLLVDKVVRKESQHPFGRLYDLSANAWHILPDTGDDLRFTDDAKLSPAFWCELRWDAVP